MTLDERDALIKEFDLKVYHVEKIYGNTHIKYTLGFYSIEFTAEEQCKAFELPFYIYIYISFDTNESHKTKDYNMARTILKEIAK